MCPVVSVPSSSSSPSSSSLMLGNASVLVPDESPMFICGTNSNFLQRQATVQSESDEGYILSTPLAPYPYSAPYQAPVEHNISPHRQPPTPDSPFIPELPPSSPNLMLDNASVLIPEGSPICDLQGFYPQQATVRSESDDGYIRCHIPSAPIIVHPPYPHIISPYLSRPPTPDPPFIPGPPHNIWGDLPALRSPVYQPSFISHKRYEEGEDHFVRRWQKW